MQKSCSDQGLHRILTSYLLAHFYLMKKSAALIWFGLRDVGILYSRAVIQDNWCLSRIFGARFGRKDCGLSTCKLWSTQAGGWILFFMKRLQTLNSYQIFKIKNQKPMTVDVLFKAYPIVPLSCRFNRPDGTFKLNDFSEDLYGPGISWNNMDKRVDSINNDGQLEWLARQFGVSLIWYIRKSGFSRAARTRFIRSIYTQN